MTLPWSEDRRLARLLRRSREGDREAFRALFRALYPRVLAFARRRARSEADAEDAVGRAFLKVLEKLHSWDEARGSVMAWVISIVRNSINDESSRIVPDLQIPEDAPSGGATPYTEVERRQELQALQARMTALPPELRQMFELRYAEGLTHGQIAELFGLSEAAVKQRFSRALRELRQEVSS